MIARLRWPLLLATAAGFAAALWALGRAGWRAVLASATAIGLLGFIGLCLVTCATFVLLGGSWLAGARGVPVRRLGRFAWARAVREAANDLLPFSQLGGIVLGIRAVLARPMPVVPVYAATVVDLTTEMAAQLVFTLFAVWLLGGSVAGRPERIDLLLWAGLGVATAFALVFFLCQQPAIRFMGLLARRVLPQAEALADEVGAELAAVYAGPARVALSFVLNLLAWLATAGWSWAALRLMGRGASLAHVAALESAIFALRSAAFLVPGGLGVQEAGYAVLAPLVGIDPAAALALSLLRRARDVTLGVPTLLLWQAEEVRAAVRQA